MPCSHKFFGHHLHMANENGLLPSWDVDTLIIGTFNPSKEWVPNNSADYFYGRPRNYFWNVLPRFAGSDEIKKNDLEGQHNFLRNKRIGLTDLLISIDDADIKIQDHIKRIGSFKDDDLNIFKKLKWNTPFIKQFISAQNVKRLHFTKLGGAGIFENQMIEIENYCSENNILSNRLFTPSGQRIGIGKPRKNKLIHEWHKKNGDNRFMFISPSFDLKNFAWK